MNGLSFRKQFFKKTMAGVLTLALGACAAAQTGEPRQTSYDYDPIEPFNRCVYEFNYTVDQLILEPFAHIYRGVVPEPGRQAVTNFFRNLSEPVNFANAVFQADARQAHHTFWRFVLNTTLGGAGLFDFAKHNTDLNYREEDFGQTLATAGVPSGPYLVLPFLGPSSFRDAPSLVVDYFINPFNYAFEEDTEVVLGVTEGVDARERRIELMDEIYETSFDPYATIRSGYLQRRDDLIRNGEVREESY